jgi:hypothetical protein
MSRERLLVILTVIVAVGAVVYFVAFRPVVSEGVVDHKTITGTWDQASYSIVVFTTAGNHFDDKEVRGLFDESDIGYSERHYGISVGGTLRRGFLHLISKIRGRDHGILCEYPGFQ